jgi:hypothetical protein
MIVGRSEKRGLNSRIFNEFNRLLSERVRPLSPNAERGCVDLGEVADVAQQEPYPCSWR